MALLGNEAGLADQAIMAGTHSEYPSTRSNCSLFSLDVVAIFAIVHCVRLLCSLFYFVLTNQTCKLLDSSSRFALTAAASWERTARFVWHVAWWGMRHAAAHVEHWTEATLMISVRQCKTDKTHFQIVHSLRDFREKIYKTNMKKECETEKKKKREGNLSNQTIL